MSADVEKSASKVIRRYFLAQIKPRGATEWLPATTLKYRTIATALYGAAEQRTTVADIRVVEVRETVVA